ncbi:hypothetical protein J2Z83_002114 [Virgibacillus natechei]|uniref:Uncharacterized protein n=1 Tax=Virgibacillus natechei TaxID=1216297 RepID=A0ABS4IGD1_9BACI|nr:hypothetical protein [Virgibacillus natechei]MBP1970006.1 hypothetical protein [Virgibacillus natechei]UZD13337.1 hypothetical protein OLD84_01880 [Virgibacillus natechei]
MINMFLFELKKIVKSTFFFIMLLLFCLFIVGYYVFVYINTVRADELITEIESSVHIREENIEELKDLNSDDENGDSQLEQEIQFSEEYLAREKTTLEAFQNKDWFTVLNQEIKIDEESGVRSSNIQYNTSSFQHLLHQKHVWNIPSGCGIKIFSLFSHLALIHGLRFMILTLEFILG